ncbi:uncharacterized protein Dvar_71050 [Desulfosarcina variabilis str. Montpellier]
MGGCSYWPRLPIDTLSTVAWQCFFKQLRKAAPRSRSQQWLVCDGFSPSFLLTGPHLTIGPAPVSREGYKQN